MIENHGHRSTTAVPIKTGFNALKRIARAVVGLERMLGLFKIRTNPNFFDLLPDVGRVSMKVHKSTARCPKPACKNRS